MINSGGGLHTSEGAYVTVGDVTNYDVELTIKGNFFGIQGIKELRKFLKKIQRQLESNEVACIDDGDC